MNQLTIFLLFKWSLWMKGPGPTPVWVRFFTLTLVHQECDKTAIRQSKSAISFWLNRVKLAFKYNLFLIILWLTVRKLKSVADCCKYVGIYVKRVALYQRATTRPGRIHTDWARSKLGRCINLETNRCRYLISLLTIILTRAAQICW